MDASLPWPWFLQKDDSAGDDAPTPAQPSPPPAKPSPKPQTASDLEVLERNPAAPSPNEPKKA